MQTIDIAELENVTGGAGRWTALKKVGEWGGRLLNWGGAGFQVADWLSGGKSQPAQPAQPATQPQPPASH